MRKKEENEVKVLIDAFEGYYVPKEKERKKTSSLMFKLTLSTDGTAKFMHDGNHKLLIASCMATFLKNNKDISVLLSTYLELSKEEK
jgi:hypothetical protein